MKYFYSDPSVVTSPSKMITMPSNEVKFTMSNDDLSKLKKPHLQSERFTRYGIRKEW